MFVLFLRLLISGRKLISNLYHIRRDRADLDLVLVSDQQNMKLFIATNEEWVSSTEIPRIYGQPLNQAIILELT